MKDEIKEILNQLEIVARKHTIEVCEDGSKIETMPASVVDELRLNNYSSKILLDYITNLQEENERLKALNKEYVYELGLNEFEHTTIIDTDYKDKYLDYKSRNEKAIEYINSSHFIYDVQYKKKDKLENILNGDDE